MYLNLCFFKIHIIRLDISLFLAHNQVGYDSVYYQG